MKFLFAFCTCVSVSVWLLPVAGRAAGYVWDNQNGNGLWNDPVNWGMTNNPGYNVVPTASDGAIFLKNVSPNGTVTLNGDGFAQYLRQDSTRAYRVVTINSGEVVDRTLSLAGTGSALIDGPETWVDFSLDGTPNANGARLKLYLGGSGTTLGTRINKAVTLRVSCDVSGPGGFILNGGVDGPGRLILSGFNTYTGPTAVNSGVLLINGSTAAGSVVTVNSGAVLAGTGIINGPVTVNAGGQLSPGVNSQAPLIGTLIVSNNLTLAGDVLVEVNKSLAPSNDMVFVSGTLANTGAGTIQVLVYGQPLVAGDTFHIFNKPLVNGQDLRILSSGSEAWTNKLAVDGSIAVLSAANTPLTGDPTNVFTWKGAVTVGAPWRVPMQAAANWVQNQAPAPGSSNIFVFQGDILVPYQWPYIDTNYGPSILVFSNNTALNSIKILAGSNNTMRLGSYVRQDTAQPCYFGITGSVDIKGTDNVFHTVTCAFFTNELGDATCGSQTDFQCTGGRLDVYGVLSDGAGTSSRLVKSGTSTLNLTGDLSLGNDPNTYTGGTLVNAGVIKMAKSPGVNCIPGDVSVNGPAGLVMNVRGGEQIANSAVVALHDSSYLSLGGQPETIRTVESTSAATSVNLGVDSGAGTAGTLVVSPLATSVYNSGIGVSEFAGAIVGPGTLRMNGTGTYGILGANSVTNLEVNSGTLKINGNTAPGMATINGGATLMAKGTMANRVAVNSGGTLEAGFGIGQLTLTAGLNLGGGATNLWELAAYKDMLSGVAGIDFDQIVLAGGVLGLDSQATLTLRFIGSAMAPDTSQPFWQSSHTWRVISLAGGSNPQPASFGSLVNGTYPAGNFHCWIEPGGSIMLTFTPNPRIGSVAGAGTTNVTVIWSNAVPRSNYILQYNTNLSTPDWYNLSPVSASDSAAWQLDHPPTGDRQRYYRVRIQ